MSVLQSVDEVRAIGIVVLFDPPDDVGAHIRNMELGGLPMIAVYNACDERRLDQLSIECEAEFLALPDNEGLAEAFNVGIRRARDRHAENVFLFDQDSRPAADLPLRLLEVLEIAQSEQSQVAAIGPVPSDVKVAVNERRMVESRGWHEVPTLISSGMLIPMRALDEVGVMWSELFIDHIDHEWCFRAQSLGWIVIQAEGVYMTHDLGDVGIRVFGRFKGIHRSPFRHYHILRNTLAMLGIARIPLSWRVSEALKTVYRVPVYLAVSSDRAATVRAFRSAFADFKRIRAARPRAWG